MKRALVSISIVLALIAGLVPAWLIIRPWQSKILTRGYSPEGREHCVVQTFKGFIEPYQVSFYIRDAEGVWRWNYLAHQDNGWKTATVTFSQGAAQISRNGTPFKVIEVPTDQVDLTQVLPGYRNDYCDGSYSVEDVFEFHNLKYQ